jgi:cyclic pyranopterin phosphate synthase
MFLHDSHGRRITDLRISVTDRCNYRCVYCRAGNNGAQYAELPIADYLRMARLLAALGVEKIRLTGGEPLLRSGLLDLIRELAQLKTLSGAPLDLAITTNGHLLAEMAEPLQRAGLNRATVSMDAVDPAEFARITRVANGYDAVLAGVRAARRAGLAPVKVNCVLLRGFNDDQVLPFARFAAAEGVVVRFIEFMPLEEDRVWSPEIVVPLEEILATLGTEFEVTELDHAGAETARRYSLRPLTTHNSQLTTAEVGIIAPVSHPFCGHCSRVRITSDGKLRTCLFSQSDHDLIGRMRAGASDAELTDYIRRVVDQKEARHHIGEPGFQPPSRTMVHIGG